MAEEKAYWWVSVDGNACEPAVLVGAKVYTFGRVLVEEIDIPDTPREAAKKEAAWERQRMAAMKEMLRARSSEKVRERLDAMQRYRRFYDGE
jgi:hypothetical protein